MNPMTPIYSVGDLESVPLALPFHSELQTQPSTCLLGISTSLSLRHLKFRLSQK